MRWTLLALALAAFGCEFEAPSSDLNQTTNVPKDVWDRCVDTVGEGAPPGQFALCLKMAVVNAGDAGTQD